MADACCGLEGGSEQIHEEPERFWQLKEARAAAASGVLLVVGLAADLGGKDWVAIAAYGTALMVGGSTFVPGAARRLLREGLGVDTLMAVASTGTVILGEARRGRVIGVPVLDLRGARGATRSLGRGEGCARSWLWCRTA